jgi:hypothetical protein
MTPSEAIIRSRGREVALQWNRPRFIRLATAIDLTIGELAAMVGLSNRDLSSCFVKNRFTVPVALHLENIEQYIKRSKLKVRYESMPPQMEVLQQKEKELCP